MFLKKLKGGRKREETRKQESSICVDLDFRSGFELNSVAEKSDLKRCG